ncbi:hypothetical protein PFISCL1PPCAC_24219, partial [Pristionchus fissidentatus]
SSRHPTRSFDSRSQSISSSLSILPPMDNRPPSSSSNTSFTRVYRIRSNPRPFTIDTSRAKSNQPVVALCSRKIGITEYPNAREDNKPCDIYWHNVVYSDIRNVVGSATSRVNKFPGMTELAKKISLTHSITSMQRIFPHEYSFYPKSWFLPAHLDQFRAHCEDDETKRECDNSDKKAWYIVKPDEGAQGTGIYLINNPSQLKNEQQRMLVQEYVADPFLMGDQLKFDFRVYGVIKSLNPLSIYVAREGMARFCTEKYSPPTSSNFENLYSHLTNYSLNKGHGAYVHSTNLQDQVKGSKRLLSTVFHQLESRGLKTKKLWHDIKLIIVKTVLAMLPEVMLHYEHHFFDAAGPQCFQIMGFDIMVRDNGEPILLEVNAAPSLTIDHLMGGPTDGDYVPVYRVRSVVDEVIKIPLVRDTLLLVLNLLDEEYGKSSPSTSSSAHNPSTQDDMGTLKTRRKPHLSEIFPTRYGHCSGHLLFLDKAVYLFMQFVNLKHTVNITMQGIKQLIKKCNLSNIVSTSEAEEKVREINYYFTGDDNTFSNGLCFHAFLMFLHWVSERKFAFEDDTLARLQRLMAFCDSALRFYGVRSARLRRTEVESSDSSLEIYMLPTRLKASKRRSKSQQNPSSTTQRSSRPSDRNNNPPLVLPKI